MALWSSDGPGGELVRRLAPGAIFLPVALAYLAYVGERHGVFGVPEGLALLSAGLVAIFGALVVLTAGALSAPVTANWRSSTRPSTR